MRRRARLTWLFLVLAALPGADVRAQLPTPSVSEYGLLFSPSAPVNVELHAELFCPPHQLQFYCTIDVSLPAGADPCNLCGVLAAAINDNGECKTLGFSAVCNNGHQLVVSSSRTDVCNGSFVCFDPAGLAALRAATDHSFLGVGKPVSFSMFGKATATPVDPEIPPKVVAVWTGYDPVNGRPRSVGVEVETVPGMSGEEVASRMALSFNQRGVPEVEAVGSRLVFSPPTVLPSTMVPVGQPGNPPDPQTGAGAVSYPFVIGRSEVTNDFYAEFLNAVAASQPPFEDPHGLYNTLMSDDPRGGIVRLRSSLSEGPRTVTYTAKPDMGSKPVNFVSAADALRFANWLANGRSSGIQNSSTTEAGAYTLAVPHAARSAVRQPGARWWLPSDDEWLKAGYYDSARGEYWLYPTRSDTPPLPAQATTSGDVSNPDTDPWPPHGVANYASAADWNGQFGNVTTVGSTGSDSASPYGTVDQGGNVREWTEGDGKQRGMRGGGWASSAAELAKSDRTGSNGLSETSDTGFRIAGAPADRRVSFDILIGSFDRGLDYSLSADPDLLCDIYGLHCDTWTRTATTGPAARYDHALAYDLVRRVTVLYGGIGENKLVDTWKWDGLAWSAAAGSQPAPAAADGPRPAADVTDGPGVRLGHALAYDGASRQVLLFGGYSSSGYAGDTWAWRLGSWKRITTVGPGARYGSAMAYDSARNRIVLFGGRNGSTYGSGTWEWNGQTWTQVATGGPEGREGHSMAYDAARAKVVLFGGFAGGRYLGDTWEWDGQTWTQVAAAAGPAPRSEAGMAYAVACGRVVLFGGIELHGLLGDSWEWDGQAWTQVATGGPTPRRHPGMAYDAARGKVVLFGGFDTSGYRNDTWERGCGHP